jgi:GNAT superfamily N-acetyltransferase
MVRIRHVDGCHYTCAGDGTAETIYEEVNPHRLLPRQAKDFWKTWCLSPSEHGFIALDGHRLVGFFRYYLEEKDWWTLCAAGTWVAPSHRGQGIALKLWSAAQRREQCRRLEATVVSEGGQALVKAFQKKFPKVKVKLK